MKKSTSLVFLFLISLASAAQVSNTVFPKSIKQKSSISAGNLRMAAADKQRLDSIVTSVFKYTYTYDAAGNSILEDGYQWGVDTKSWVLSGRDEYAYDAAGNIILYIRYSLDSKTKKMMKSYKDEYTYDVKKNQTSEIKYDWSAVANTWLQKYKSESVFNANGLISQSREYYWTGAQWADNGNTQYAYTDKKLLTESEYSSTNILQSKKTYTYDAYGNNLSELWYFYDYDGKLYNNSKYEYAYDAKNNQIRSIRFRWNSTIEEWEKEYKFEQEFDLQNNNTIRTESEWSTTEDAWVYSDKYVYSYDNTYEITDLIVPVEFDDVFKYKITNVVTYYFKDEDWVEELNYTLYYKTVMPTSIRGSDSKALTVYPNPANDRVVFTNKTNDAATLQLFNQQGILVLDNGITMNQAVSIEGIAKGMYFYRISNGDAESYNGTLIIE